eukprot:CAMPEP_0173407836 /NCGR_PEP_ID=MMETSP1356-20130122/68191_1 /TAXON_ID=77927 ORGANISM="Hemiselmis virescens, Strain PCC157" /NCGR_SAMPLE_ID=MMETSP1356 /ASSEMBLY_ACC=CAM_ASM_000847 /LENGTH=312 /DNA_ID=CAMNT_0014369061 /DNA_START=122 /DNA_END=1057 /DNA_ORIENTATION=+
MAPPTQTPKTPRNKNKAPSAIDTSSPRAKAGSPSSPRSNRSPASRRGSKSPGSGEGGDGGPVPTYQTYKGVYDTPGGRRLSTCSIHSEDLQVLEEKGGLINTGLKLFTEEAPQMEINDDDPEPPASSWSREKVSIWTKLQGMQSAIKILSGKDEVAKLVINLRGAMEGMRDVLDVYERDRERLEQHVRNIGELPELESVYADAKDMLDKAGAVPKRRAMRSTFVYDPDDVQDRFIPGVGIRPVQSHKGNLVKVVEKEDLGVAALNRKSFRKRTGESSPLPPNSPNLPRMGGRMSPRGRLSPDGRRGTMASGM